MFFRLVHPIFVARKEKKYMESTTETIDTYRLTSLEEPTEEMLSQLMKEAAEDAKRKNEEATAKFFRQLKQDALKISLAW